jgi:hypothetical protein
VINEGNHRARCTGEADAQFGYSSNGTEQIALLFDLLDESDQPTGDRITWFGYFSEKAVPIAIKALRACGWQGDNFTDLTGVESQVVELVVKHEPYEDRVTGEQKVSAKVAFINQPGAGGRVEMKKQMDAGQRAAFAAKMRGALVAEKQAARPATRPAARPAPKASKPWDGTGADPNADDLAF